jgi:hypothetical protein
MKDSHKKLELDNARRIKLAELQAGEQDDAARANLQNQKAMHDREKHQLDMFKSAQDVELDRQKADLAIQSHQVKAAEMQQRQEIARQQATINAASKGFVP